ncbi:hypothetical protein J6590_074376 [Homalodisca vitripennis]|nr:hypothetical protein J6590_074376 [Homalodisca vitripennis]
MTVPYPGRSGKKSRSAAIWHHCLKLDYFLYLILGHTYEHLGLIIAMEDMKLFDNGEYWVVGADIDQYDAEAPEKYIRGLLRDEADPRATRGYRSYLGVVPTPPRGFQNFSLQVNALMERPPFNYPNPVDIVGGVKRITAEAAYLYDAVLLYARAVLEILDEGGDPRNGSDVIRHVKGRHYHSAMGFMVYMDENGDAEGNYTLLGRRPHHLIANDYGLYPVGLFTLGERLPELRLTEEIDWGEKGCPPIAEPPCGFRGEKCINYTRYYNFRSTETGGTARLPHPTSQFRYQTLPSAMPASLIEASFVLSSPYHSSGPTPSTEMKLQERYKDKHRNRNELFPTPKTILVTTTSDQLRQEVRHVYLTPPRKFRYQTLPSAMPASLIEASFVLSSPYNSSGPTPSTGNPVFRRKSVDEFLLTSVEKRLDSVRFRPVRFATVRKTEVWPASRARGHCSQSELYVDYLIVLCLSYPAHTMEILGGVLGGTSAVLILVLLLVYRNWRYEQELDSLLWKVDFKDIQMNDNEQASSNKINRATHPLIRTSQVSLSSNPDADFRYSSIYTQIGIYRGRALAIKTVAKKTVDITRNMKKELKTLRDLRHDNLNAFIGACTDPPHICIVTEYCTRGSLKDILENEDVKLDNMFVASLVADIIRGLIYLQDSPLHFHGNLKASNCLVDSRWVVKLADFGLSEFKSGEETHHHYMQHTFFIPQDESSSCKCEGLLYRAPESLRITTSYPGAGSQKGDVYSFGIILYELHSRKGPFGDSTGLSTAEILRRVIHYCGHEPPFRPPLELLENSFDFVRDCLKECWQENPDDRPDIKTVRTRLRPMRKGMKPNIFDNMIAMMEKYANNLEVLVDERTDQLVEEKKKTGRDLHNYRVMRWAKKASIRSKEGGRRDKCLYKHR